MIDTVFHNPMRENAYDVPALTIAQCKQIEADSRMILTTPEIYELRRIVITGCGDSYAAGLSVKPALEHLTGLSVDVEPAMHLARYTEPDTFGKPGSTLVMAVSNSGGVARVAEAVQRASSYGCLTLAITGKPESKLAKAAAKRVPLAIPPFAAGGGNGVRSYLISMLSLLLVGIRIGEVKGRYMMSDSEDYRKAICDYAGAFEKALPEIDEKVLKLAEETNDKELFEFLGSGGNLGSAWFSQAKIIEATGDAATFTDLEAWMHLNCFFRELSKKVAVAYVNADGPDRSRADETLDAISRIPSTVVAITDDVTILPDHVQAIQIPKCKYDWLAPLLNYLPVALYAGYLCEMKHETYGRDGRAEWAPISGTKLLTESKIVLI